MTVSAWQPGTLYLRGAVVKATARPPSVPGTLVNADFESGDTDWTKGTGFSITTGSAFSGTYSAKYSGSPHTSAFIEQTAYVAVSPGETVAATCMVKQGASSAGDAGGSVWIRWYDASHNLLPTQSEGNVVDSGSNGEWKRSSVSARAPGSAAYFRIAGKCYLEGSGQPLWLDKFTLSYTPTTPAGTDLIFRATQDDPGTSAAIEPDWPNTVGATVVDNTVTWEGVGTGYVTWEAHALMVSDGTEPDWPTSEDGVVADGTIEWEAVSTRITDENCPNTKVVAIAASKVFAVDRDVVRYCATANPLDWTTAEDAGYLPTGLRQGNANDMAVLQTYRSNLACWNANGFQMWQVDPDPTQMAILDQMEGIGSTEQRAAQGVANDLLFLSQLGVRSVGIANAAENLAAADVGSPIDVLVREAMAVAGARVIGTYYPGAGQFWMAMTAGTPYEITIEGALPDGYIGDSGFMRYTIKGGVAPLTCSITAGALPPDASIDDTGLVTYDYTTAGDYAWMLTVTDAEGNTATYDDGASVAALPVVGYDATGIPYKFMYSTDPDINTDFSGVAYDDSAWSTGQGGFGFASPAGAQTLHTPTDRGFDSRIWIRQPVAMAAGRDCVVEIWRDDGCQFYWNGVEYPVVATGDYYRVTVTIPGADVTGDDLAALRVTDGRDDNGDPSGTDGIYASMNFQSL